MIGRTVVESKPAWLELSRVKDGASNIIFFILDNVYGYMSAFGELVNTPNLDSQSGGSKRAEYTEV